MAPEAFDGRRSVGTDLWAVGVLLYELLTGGLPFPEREMTSLVGAIMTRDPLPLPSSIPLGLRKIVFKTLTKDPRSRYQSADEMRRDLGRANHELRVGPLQKEPYGNELRTTIQCTPSLIRPASASANQVRIGAADKPQSEELTKIRDPLPVASRNRIPSVLAVVIAAIIILGVLGINYLGRHPIENRGVEITSPSGLRYTDLVVGTGAQPQKGQTVSIHYSGTLENGEEFDSSRRKGSPLEYKFGVTPMIPGWDEGVSTMKVGGRRKLVVPARLGYGQQGRPGIPPNATLLFDLELLAVK